MNPAVGHVALVLGGIAAVVFIAWLVFCALPPPPLPPEPPIVMTCTARDAGR